MPIYVRTAYIHSHVQLSLRPRGGSAAKLVYSNNSDALVRRLSERTLLFTLLTNDIRDLELASVSSPVMSRESYGHFAPPGISDMYHGDKVHG